MTSEYPAGLTRDDIAFVLQHDPEALSVEAIDEAKALWRVTYSVDGRQSVQMVVDNGINPIYVQTLIQIDADHIVEALTTLESYGVVGLTVIGGSLFMRSGFFIEHSTMHALTNSWRAVVLAYLQYQQAISE